MITLEVETNKKTVKISIFLDFMGSRSNIHMRVCFKQIVNFLWSVILWKTDQHAGRIPFLDDNIHGK